MDSRIIIGDKLDLQKVDSQYSDNPNERAPVYASKVLDEMENGNMLLSMPILDRKMVPVSVGQELVATFYTKAGLLRCQIEVIARYKKGNLYFMEVLQQTELQKIQRREYYRMECYILIEYRIVEEEERRIIESGGFYDLQELPEWKSGVMLDLSGGGSHFTSSFQEEKDSMIQVRFDIYIGNDIETMHLYALLLRSERNANNSSVFDNYIMFQKVAPGTREKIIRYIFDAQRKNRSKATGMN